MPGPGHGDWSAASGYRAARDLFEDPTCTAVLCANDETALGLLYAAPRQGQGSS